MHGKTPEKNKQQTTRPPKVDSITLDDETFLNSFLKKRTLTDTEFTRLIRIAESGNLKAMKHLAWQYAHGDCFEINSDKAREWSEKAYGAGDEESAYSIGLIYKEGRGSEPVNYAKAYEWFSKVKKADIMLMQATIDIAYLYATGDEFFPRDDGEAEKWIQKARDLADGGSDWLHSAYQYLLGSAFQTKPPPIRNYEESLEWFRKSADNGYDSSLVKLAVAYYKGGWGAEKDTDKAWGFLSRAITQRPASREFFFRHISSKERAEVEKWIAEEGKSKPSVISGSSSNENECISPDTINEIKMLLYGVGTDPDYEGALKLLSEHMTESDNVTGNDLADILKPDDKENDVTSSYMVKNLVDLAWAGNANAQYNMGMIHYYGIANHREDYAASQWFVKAADGGHPNGVRMAEKSGAYRQRAERKGLMTEAYQKYRERDYKKSVELYKKASEQNHGGLAAMWVGSLYERGGNGIEKNLDTAVEWYLKAVEKGHDFALGDLGELYSSSKNPTHRDEDKAIEYAEKQLIAMPDNFIAHRDSANIYAQLGDFERAVELQRKAIFLGKRRGVESDKSIENAERALRQYLRNAE